MFLLDTNTCIQFLNGRSHHVAHRLRLEAPGRLRLCAIVKAELLFGAARSTHPERTRAVMEGFFSCYESLPFDDAAAACYGPIRQALSDRGTPIGPNDLLIAAIAVSRNLIVVTHNTREFSRVPGLAIEDWELPAVPAA